MPKHPDLSHEQLYWQQGIATIAGIDEVGMGALAGPVVAAAVILRQESGMRNQELGKKRKIPSIRDSKTVSAKQREQLVPYIHRVALAWAIGEASVAEITALNIRRAAHLAMQRAVDQLAIVPELLLIDGNPAQPHPDIPATNIIGGDGLSLSIAAASILAKVYRDSLMVELDAKFPAYGFAGHKGYGSQKHLDALAEHGPCEHHRPSYAPVAASLRVNKIKIQS